MNNAALADFRLHAARDYPREACGLLVGVRGRAGYVPCKNVASDPMQHFILSPDDYLAAEKAGQILGICHTHPDATAEPSPADRAACEATRMPWFILSWPGGDLNVVKPDGYKVPLLERPFVHGVLDCYALIRDYYEQELSIQLPEFEREDDWWYHGGNLYVENYEKAGFRKIDGLNPHDVIVMQVGAGVKVPNHAGIYLGNGMMLHHLWGRLSRRDVYGGQWLKHTNFVLRHRMF